MMNSDDIRKAAMNEFRQIQEALLETEKNEMLNSCKAMFTLYKGFVDAGFNDKQALQLVIATIQAAIAGNGGKENGK